MQLGALIAVAVLALGSVAHAEKAEPFRQIENVVYGETDGVGLVMDVFVPATRVGPGKGLGIVCVTSGEWKSDRGMVDAHRKIGIFDVLCSHGYTVFAVRPGSYFRFTGEDMLANVKTGIRYIKAHARQYRIDPARLGLVGVSAGGHLACLAATRSDPGDPSAKDPLDRLSTQVKAVGAFCPATDFLDWNGKKYGLDLMGWRLAFSDGVAGKTEQQKEDAARAVSPIYFVKPGLPPFFIVNGDADSVIPYTQSVRFVDALRKAGVPVEYTLKPGADHSWPTIREDFERLAEWFDKELATNR